MMDMANAGWELPPELHHLAESGGKKEIAGLIELFKQDVGERLQLLRRAVATSDLGLIQTQAHSIKGSAIQMGAHNLVTTCKHLELDASHGVTANLRRLLSEADAELRVLRTCMRLTH